MTDEHHHEHNHARTQRTLSISKWVLIGFLIITGYFLVTEHRAHMFAFLPFVFLLACPLMHIFMHGGHGGHDHSAHDATDNKKGEK